MNAAVINQCQQVEVALVKVILVRHVSFMRHFKKYADRINTKYAKEICKNMV